MKTHAKRNRSSLRRSDTPLITSCDRTMRVNFTHDRRLLYITNLPRAYYLIFEQNAEHLSIKPYRSSSDLESSTDQLNYVTHDLQFLLTILKITDHADLNPLTARLRAHATPSSIHQMPRAGTLELDFTGPVPQRFLR